jgi:hypothetical protein
MQASMLRGKVIQEIRQIPEEKLPEVYTLLHFFRLGVETTKPQPQEMMQFAGCWRDMPEHEFQNFLQEIQERRQDAFSGRIQREAIID